MRRGSEREGVGMGGAMGNGAELRNEKRKGEERCGEACVGMGWGWGGVAQRYSTRFIVLQDQRSRDIAHDSYGLFGFGFLALARHVGLA